MELHFAKFSTLCRSLLSRCECLCEWRSLCLPFLSYLLHCHSHASPLKHFIRLGARESERSLQLKMLNASYLNMETTNFRIIAFWATNYLVRMRENFSSIPFVTLAISRISLCVCNMCVCLHSLTHTNTYFHITKWDDSLLEVVVIRDSAMAL